MKHRLFHKLRSPDITPLFLFLSMLDRWIMLHLYLGSSIFGSTYYNTYTLQAMAWRSGSLHLPFDYPALELAVFKGDYYVSFPPLPSLVLLPFTFLFGEQTPDNLLVKLYTLAACIGIYYALRRMGYQKLSAFLFSYLFCFASSLLPMTLDGAVWYHAQVLAFMLIVLSVCMLFAKKVNLALVFYALSVACRPFDALYALPLFFLYFRRSRKENIPVRSMLLRILPGLCIGFCIASALAVYNSLRFGNPLEFGHNYLPEFSTQGGTQFALSHVLNNIKTFVLGFPWERSAEGIVFKKFGFSFLIACPMLLLILIWAIKDAVKARLSPEKGVVLFTFFLHLFFLLLHRTFGGYQLGARYMVDLIPYALFYLLLTPEKKKMHFAEGLVLFLGLIITCWGITQVHI